MSIIRVDEEDQRQLLNELKHLREQVSRLQERGTELLLENRDLRAVIKRTTKYNTCGTLAGLVDDKLTDEQRHYLKRLHDLWVQLTSGRDT